MGDANEDSMILLAGFATNKQLFDVKLTFILIKNSLKLQSLRKNKILYKEIVRK